MEDKSKLRHKKYTFPDGCSCKEAVIRESDGYDERRAAMLAGPGADDATVFTELVKLTIVQVDGAKVVHPFDAFDGWSGNTRSLVLQAYTNISKIPEEEVRDFLEEAKDILPENLMAPMTPSQTSKKMSHQA